MEEIIRRSPLTWITPTEVMEYIFCPRFIYFLICLQIPQNEEQRYKVLLGREIHKKKSKMNPNYLRIKLGVKNKWINQYLTSEKYGIKGEVDEVLLLQDDTMAPLDYKFAEYNERLFNTIKYQSVMYGLLIEENFSKPVNKGFVCFTRSNNKIVEIEINKESKNKVLKIINEIFKIIETGYFPKKTNSLRKCIDCCYKNICVK